MVVNGNHIEQKGLLIFYDYNCMCDKLGNNSAV